MENTAPERRIGVVLLDYANFSADQGDFDPSDWQGLGARDAQSIVSPASWPLPTSFIVPRGATAQATIAGDRVALQAFADAAHALRERCSIVVGGCGFFWAARLDPEIHLPGGVVTSGMELLPYAADLVSGPIGILTYAKAPLERLLRGHPLAGRLRVVELQQLPGWDVFGEDTCPAESVHMATIREAFVQHIRHELTTGQLVDVEALILECGVLPELRPALRTLTPIPIFDAKSYVCALAAE
ncbi:hypothetical protein [Nocardia sp. NPDC004711]